jgi:hypothetical protein
MQVHGVIAHVVRYGTAVGYDDGKDNRKNGDASNQ